MFEPMELTNDAVIKVIGVGGGGGNAVEHMVRERIEGVEFFAVNTDAQALRKTAVGQTIQIGSGITKGLGAGANPEVGRNAADEDREALRAALDGADMVFIAAGMGGGTGTGAAPVVAEVAKDLGILTVAVVTKPFNFEGKKRMAFAEQGITELSKHVDSLITIPNDKLLKVLGRGISLLDAFGAANDVLKGAVQGIAELITRPGLEDIDLSGARGVLVNITAGFDLRLDEFETVGNTIRAFASDNATVVIGTSLDPDMNDELRVTVVATGIGMDKRPEITLVTNKQVQQPVMDRYQQHGMSPLTQEQKPAAKVANDNTPQTAKEPDYLDIPAFLRKQAD